MSTAPVSSLRALARRVSRAPMLIATMADEEVVVLDPDAANPLDSPRLARFSPAEQDAARSAVLALLLARGEVVVDGQDVELLGPHAAVTAMRDQVSARSVLQVLPDDPGGLHVLVDRIGDRRLAMARLVDRAAGIQSIVAATPEQAMAWALLMLGIVVDGDERPHPARPRVQRADDPSKLDPSLLRLEAAADLVVVVTSAGGGPGSNGPMTITSGPAGVHLHRGFTTTAGQQHTLTTIAPLDLAALLATVTEPDCGGSEPGG